VLGINVHEVHDKFRGLGSCHGLGGNGQGGLFLGLEAQNEGVVDADALEDFRKGGNV